jgi:KaiC/GvpD/RAD55 family RecA-like ATPase
MKPEFNKEIFKDSSKEKKPLTTAEVTEKLKEDSKKANAQKYGFLIRTANEVIQENLNKPVPPMLFDEFWTEGEFCVFYGNTGLGKSILAVQIAQSIASGQPIEGFQIESKPQKVIYFDFELSDRQFTGRLSEKTENKTYKNPKKLSNNFYWVKRAKGLRGLNADKKKANLIEQIEYVIKDKRAKVVIIDNITAIGKNLSDPKAAQAFLDEIDEIQNEYDLSILMLAHTVKGVTNKRLDLDDLKGSGDIKAMLDSCFSIGKAYYPNSENHAYLMQMKQREEQPKFHRNNVVVMERLKDHNQLLFKYVNLDREDNLLESNEGKTYQDLRAIARDMKESGATINEIMEKTGLAKGTVSNYTRDITRKKGRNKSSQKEDSESDSLLDIL